MQRRLFPPVVGSGESSPPCYVRIREMLYLLIIAAGLFARPLVRDRLVVAGDAAATASNITAPAFMFRLGRGCRPLHVRGCGRC